MREGTVRKGMWAGDCEERGEGRGCEERGEGRGL